MENMRKVIRVCSGLVIANFLLFGTKLYIGLSVNSISIFSDAINNFFDSLSVLLAAVVLSAMLKTADKNSKNILSKTEQLFSFLISIIVVLTGFYFAYSSLERFLYPTPVWYTPLYLGVLIATALVKLGLFFAIRGGNRKLHSPVLQVVSADSLLDFFITAMTVLTLLLSSAGHFSFDALFGLIISIVIIVSAVKIVISSGAILINYVPGKKREEVNRILENAVSVKEIRYLRDDEKTEGLVFAEKLNCDVSVLIQEIADKTGINMFFIEKTEEEFRS